VGLTTQTTDPVDDAACFAAAYRYLRQVEGGSVDDPADRGGPTRWGITQRTYDAWREQCRLPPAPLAALTDAEAQRLYRTLYWEGGHCPAMPAAPLALAHFDGCVHLGITAATQVLQRALDLRADGVWGPATAAAVARATTWPAWAALLVERGRFYARLAVLRPLDEEFLPGWFARLRTLVAAMAEVAAA
jgi:lysozyme family protein